MPTASAQASLSPQAGRAAGHGLEKPPQPQYPWLEGGRSPAEQASTSSAQATDDHQTGTTSESLGSSVGQHGSLPERSSCAAPDDHLCHHRLKPELSGATSSSKSVSSSQSASPTSNTSAPAAALTAVSVQPGIDPQVAVLSVLAGVAADPASVLTLPLLPDAMHTSLGPQPSVINPLTEGRAGSDSRSASGSGPDIYNALREDRTHAKEWQVVKASRKGSASSIKATLDTSERQAGAAQQHGMASKRREQLVESHGRWQESAQDAANSNADVAHVTKPMRRSSSQASTSSWASVDTSDTHDRYTTKACEHFVYWSFPYGLLQADSVLLCLGRCGRTLVATVLLLLLPPTLPDAEPVLYKRVRWVVCHLCIGQCVEIFNVQATFL